MVKHLNIAFIGAEPLAVPVLEELEEAGIVPLVVVTGPDAPVGRGRVVTPPRTKVWALERGIEVLQPVSLKDKTELDLLVNSEWDLFILASYGKILPQWVLDLPKHGILNVHPSLLPKQRGASPVRSSILQDRKEDVGVSVMLMDAEMDHGPLVAQATVELPFWPVPARQLEELLAREGGRLLAEVIPIWVAGTIPPEEQDHSQATVCGKFEKKDGEVDLAGDPYQNWLKYCAFDGWPGVFTYIEKRQNTEERIQSVADTMPTQEVTQKVRLKITEAEYVDGEFRIIKVIPEGKKEVRWEEWAQNIGMGNGYGNKEEIRQGGRL